MGANEKYEAAMHGYVQDIGQIRDAWVDSKIYHLPKSTRTVLVPTVQAEFNRWLEQVRAEAKAEALDSLAQELVDVDMAGADEPIRAYDAAVWIRERANHYKEQS